MLERVHLSSAKEHTRHHIVDNVLLKTLLKLVSRHQFWAWDDTTASTTAVGQEIKMNLLLNKKLQQEKGTIAGEAPSYAVKNRAVRERNKLQGKTTRARLLGGDMLMKYLKIDPKRDLSSPISLHLSRPPTFSAAASGRRKKKTERKNSYRAIWGKKALEAFSRKENSFICKFGALKAFNQPQSLSPIRLQHPSWLDYPVFSLITLKIKNKFGGKSSLTKFSTSTQVCREEEASEREESCVRESERFFAPAQHHIHNINRANSFSLMCLGDENFLFRDGSSPIAPW